MIPDATSIQYLIASGLAFNILLSSGVLFKLVNFARGYGRLEEKVEGHEQRIIRVEDRVIGGK